MTEHQRTRYQKMAVEELITFEELRERFDELEETKKTAHRELESISRHRERLEELEREADDLICQYETLVSEGLEALLPEEKRRIYKTLRMKVLISGEGTVAVEIVSDQMAQTDTDSVKIEDTCS